MIISFEFSITNITDWWSLSNICWDLLFKGHSDSIQNSMLKRNTGETENIYNDH